MSDGMIPYLLSEFNIVRRKSAFQKEYMSQIKSILEIRPMPGPTSKYKFVWFLQRLFKIKHKVKLTEGTVGVDQYFNFYIFHLGVWVPTPSSPPQS